MPQEKEVNRRDFLTKMGVTVGTAGLAAATQVVAPKPVEAATPPKGNIPDKPLKLGHMTFLTGPAAVLGEHSLKGHVLAAEEINAAGGILGKRKIETITADEAAGTDANVKELRRMKLSENIDMFTGVISSGNTPALGPVAEELGVLTIFADGCTDFLFDKAVPQPKYVFRITNIQSADGVTAAVAVAQAWPQVRKIAHIHPDYSYGRNAIAHFTAALDKMVPGTEVVAEAWPKLGTTDFTAHITKLISAKPDLIASSVWGGDYVALYKQGLRYGLFEGRKFASMIAFGVAPHALGKDHPEGIVAGVHANYHFTYPAGDMWPANKRFVDAFFKRWKEYPNFEAEGAYTALMMYKLAVERANRLAGGWPDPEAIIGQLEGLGYDSPAGYIYIRADNHQGYKDAVTGFSKNLPAYEFAAWDPNRVVTIPIRNITAPPGWPKPGQGHNDDTATMNWIKTTWPKMTG
jgi:branched-chain amino acid transport system substrate-binding protein